MDRTNHILDIMEMNTNIANTVVEFGPSEKMFNEKSLKRRSSVDTKSAVVNKPSGFLPPDLETLIQSKNTISSTYMNHNNNNI